MLNFELNPAPDAIELNTLVKSYVCEGWNKISKAASQGKTSVQFGIWCGLFSPWRLRWFVGCYVEDNFSNQGFRTFLEIRRLRPVLTLYWDAALPERDKSRQAILTV
jgi:hypothetical protein